MDVNHQLLNYNDIVNAKKCYETGGNVVKFLNSHSSVQASSSDIIEVAYDLQAGDYIRQVSLNREKALAYWEETASILANHMKPSQTLLDIGTGEMTTLCGLLNELPANLVPQHTYALDISWSRLKVGSSYFETHKSFNSKFTTFVADIGKIPLCSNSVDIVISSHALEPNGKQLKFLLKELFRVAISKLILFEPCYERNSDEGKKRMDNHGYIKGLEDTIIALGATIVDVIPIKNFSNPLNPTYAFVIDVHKTKDNKIQMAEHPHFTVPGLDIPLNLMNQSYFSKEVGLSFPILDDIPILREKYGIVSTSRMLD